MSHTQQTLFFRFLAARGRDLRRFDASCVSSEEEKQFVRDWSILSSSAADGSYLDVAYDWQFRADKPYIRTEDIFLGDWFERVFCRANSGFAYIDFEYGADGIDMLSPDFDRFGYDKWTPCRYGFDRIEVRFQTPITLEAPWKQFEDRWILEGPGSYLTLNTMPMHYWTEVISPAIDANPFITLERAEPYDALALCRGLPIACIEWFWQGRVVHRAFHAEGTYEYSPVDGLWHTPLDGWDNCLWPPFLGAMKRSALARPEAVYEADVNREP